MNRQNIFVSPPVQPSQAFKMMQAYHTIGISSFLGSCPPPYPISQGQFEIFINLTKVSPVTRIKGYIVLANLHCHKLYEIKIYTKVKWFRGGGVKLLFSYLTILISVVTKLFRRLIFSRLTWLTFKIMHHTIYGFFLLFGGLPHPIPSGS